jgi:hypothetical protein
MGSNDFFNILFKYPSKATHPQYVEWFQVLMSIGGCTQHTYSVIHVQGQWSIKENINCRSIEKYKKEYDSNG